MHGEGGIASVNPDTGEGLAPPEVMKIAVLGIVEDQRGEVCH